MKRLTLTDDERELILNYRKEKHLYNKAINDALALFQHYTTDWNETVTKLHEEITNLKKA